MSSTFVTERPHEAAYAPREAGVDPKEVAKRAKRANETLRQDRIRILDKCDNYLRGIHDKPYFPNTATKETRMLAERAVTNWMPLLVGVPSQVSLVDGFRRAGVDNPPEFATWDENRMGSRQTRTYRSALTYGHSFVAVDVRNRKRIKLRSLSPLNTVAFYDDPGSDTWPVYVYHILENPTGDIPGRALYWDDQIQCEMSFTSEGDFTPIENTGFNHGLEVCPVGRFVCELDLEGRVRGLVEMMMPIQNRINQTVFDLMVAQTYGAFMQRWAAGLTGDPVFDENGEPLLDDEGNVVTKSIETDPSRFLTSDDPNTKFGTLDATPLDGFIAALEAAIHHFAAISQIPPHALLGQMANLSAEALAAAEAQLMRFVETLQNSWGETWLGIFQLIAKAKGVDVDEANGGQVRWRDMRAKTLASTIDALGKGAQMLDIPKRGLWSRFPGATDADVEEWTRLAEEQGEQAAESDPTAVYARSLAAERAKVRFQAPGDPAVA